MSRTAGGPERHDHQPVVVLVDHAWSIEFLGHIVQEHRTAERGQMARLGLAEIVLRHVDGKARQGETDDQNQSEYHSHVVTPCPSAAVGRTRLVSCFRSLRLCC